MISGLHFYSSSLICWSHCSRQCCRRKIKIPTPVEDVVVGYRCATRITYCTWIRTKLDSRGSKPNADPLPYTVWRVNYIMGARRIRLSSDRLRRDRTARRVFAKTQNIDKQKNVYAFSSNKCQAVDFVQITEVCKYFYKKECSYFKFLYIMNSSPLHFFGH